MTRKYATSDRTWTRAFGPFDTRGKAKTFQNKQIRELRKEYGWKDDRINEEFTWQIVQLWNEKGHPYAEGSE